MDRRRIPRDEGDSGSELTKERIAVGSPVGVLFVVCDRSSGAPIHTVDAP